MLDELVKLDVGFNEASFKSYIDNVFVKLFTAVMLNEVPNVRHFLSDEVYSEYEKISADNSARGVIHMYDELNVKSSNITGVSITDDEFRIEVLLVSRYMDYLLDSESGEVIRGNNTSRIEVRYKLVFTKKRQFLQQGAVRKCPGCGASISVNTKGVCEYCGALYNMSDYNYILSSITKIS